MSTRRLGAALLVAGALLALAPQLAAAHALGGVFTLPVPLGLYLAAAGAAVAASFVVAVLVVRPAGPVARDTRPGRSASAWPGPHRSCSRWWGWRGGSASSSLGLVVDPISPLPAVAALDRDLGRPADQRGPAGQPVAVAEPVPHALQRARAPGPIGGAHAAGCRPPLPGLHRPLAIHPAARRGSLRRADPARPDHAEHDRHAARPATRSSRCSA